MNIEFVEKIIGVFISDNDIELTINELCKRSKLSYNATHRTVQDLLKSGILNMKKFGKASVISLNKEAAKGFLVMTAYEKANKFFAKKEDVYNILNSLRQNISKKLPNQLLSMFLIKQTAKSADILFLVSGKDVSNIIKKECESVNEIKIKPIILTNEEFAKRKNEFKKVIPLLGAENYFR